MCIISPLIIIRTKLGYSVIPGFTLASSVTYSQLHYTASQIPCYDYSLFSPFDTFTKYGPTQATTEVDIRPSLQSHKSVIFSEIGQLNYQCYPCVCV